MKQFPWLPVLLGAVLLSAAPVPADDGFYVIAGRAALGTKITSLPYTIKAPGYYYLGGNLTGPSDSDGITFASGVNNVTIDLMGFSLTGPNNVVSCGVYMSGRKNVEVRNGTISGWYTGVYEVGDGGSQHRVIGVRAAGNQYGIVLHGTDHLIKGCTASPGTDVSGSGLIIYGSATISGCTAMNFIYGYGIFLSRGTASGNVVLNCSGDSAYGISASAATIRHNQVSNCTTGIEVMGGGSIIGNVVRSNTDQTGIVPSYDTTTPNILDQNNVSGPGTHYGPGSAATVWGLNGGR